MRAAYIGGPTNVPYVPNPLLFCFYPPQIFFLFGLFAFFSSSFDISLLLPIISHKQLGAYALLSFFSLLSFLSTYYKNQLFKSELESQAPFSIFTGRPEMDIHMW